MSTGFHKMISVGGHPIEEKLGFANIGQALFDCYNHLLDGYGWAPLSTEWDYPATLERVHREVFADELRRVAV